MARTVKDAAYILQAIAGVDPRDNYTLAIPNGGELPDYVAACDFHALRGVRIGIPRNVIELFGSVSTIPETNAFEIAIGVLTAAGATIVDNANFTQLKELDASTAEGEVLNADFIINLATYLAELSHNPNDVHTLQDVRLFTQKSPLEEYPSRDTATWDEALDVQKYNNTSPEFWAAYQEDLALGGEGGLLGALDRHNLDAVVLPTSFSSTFGAIIGAPIVTVPLGFYPANTTVRMNRRGTLVAGGPHIP